MMWLIIMLMLHAIALALRVLMLHAIALALRGLWRLVPGISIYIQSR